MVDLLDYTLESLYELIVDFVPELNPIVGELPLQDARLRLRP
jgi:hypothetical protein